MDDRASERLRLRMQNHDTRTLEAIVGTECEGYSPQAIALAEAELAARGMAEDEIQAWSAYRAARAMKAATREEDEVRASGLTAEDLMNVASRNMAVGLLFFVGGTLVTLFTLLDARDGGTYIVAWGAIIFGGAQYFRGLDQQKLARKMGATRTH